MGKLRDKSVKFFEGIDFFVSIIKFYSNGNLIRSVSGDAFMGNVELFLVPIKNLPPLTPFEVLFRFFISFIL